MAAIPQFGPFGITEVAKGQWLKVKSRAEAVGVEALDAVTEIEDWVVKCLVRKRYLLSAGYKEGCTDENI